jgi:ABC transporter substrate binding protein
MAAAGDPLGSELVASLAQPGGNVTGMSLMAPDLGGKRLELLKELLPRFARVAVLWNAANPYSANVFKETQIAGRVLGVQVQSLEVRNPEDLDGARSSGKRAAPHCRHLRARPSPMVSDARGLKKPRRQAVERRNRGTGSHGRESNRRGRLT